MDLSLTVALNTAETTITLDDQTQIIIRQDKRLPKKEKGLLFFLNQKQLIALGLANDSNFDRNPLRGCNYGLEGGAFLILGGATTALGGALLYPWGQQ